MTIESILEMLKSKSIVQDVRIRNGRSLSLENFPAIRSLGLHILLAQSTTYVLSLEAGAGAAAAIAANAATAETVAFIASGGNK